MENNIWLRLIKNLYIFKWKKWNEFKIIYKNNLFI